ncbi:aldehyde dehydrogenase family protein [Desulfotalea psychrophila]|uniref:Probable ethanolamine utilization protein (EutE) n=1 Tax=Desulfotalea psychrophila (strain LSv54 / DSM 12343) TaxID=177439 RepID=Q6AIR2_DESPS|nr:aldehyde dehydrogenase family protein [Desulfotalea psychrophila]CAG37768.1 probable ethanolamine utilization protein (EutE) [Desulfotalea psychrophila LSv54]
MSIGREQIESIVAEVISQIGNVQQGAPVLSGSAAGDWGVFDELDDAVAAAKAACKLIDTVAMRTRVVEVMRRAARMNARPLAEKAVAETGMGNIEDKVLKTLLVANSTPGPEILQPTAITGDDGFTLIENAPWGVIASVTPSTNPGSTVINNGISMISGGNAVVFAPHPAAKRITQEAIKLMNKAIAEETGINNLLVCIKEPSLDAAQRLFTYPGINLLTVTGGEAVVKAARKVTDKRLIAAGAGNPPVVVDETADLARAAESIYIGASFDNNLICANEKEIIVVESVADQFKREFVAAGAFEISLEQAEAIGKTVLLDYGTDKCRANPKWVGRDAYKLAELIGVTIPAGCKLLFVDVKGDARHPFAVTEQMMPLIPVVRARNFDQALEWALMLERGLSHTAGLHSTNIHNMERMAKAVNTSLFVKNGPHIAGLGAGGEGWTSMTISTPTGEGVTNAATFVRLRRCALVGSFRIV